jgi:formylglycine-generating enzyme required for sulfatase activity
MWYGKIDGDFSGLENFADKTFATVGYKGRSPGGHFQVAGDVDYIMAEGVNLAERRFDDGHVVSAPIGSYKPNPFGLHDMHGNVAEWTRTTYNRYPYRDHDAEKGEKVVRGGSYLDRPERCRSSIRCSYPPWQRVHNVGFRVVLEE